MKREFKKLLIVLVTTVISLGLHSFVPVTVPITPDVLTGIANKLGFLATVTIFFLVTYYIIATVFLKFQARLWGGRICRALTFGTLVGGVWWVGMIESVFAFNTSFMGEFLTGLLDFIPIVLLCVLVSFFMVEKTKGEQEVRVSFWDLLVFTVVLVLGRYIKYVIDGQYADVMPMVLIWTATLALTIGLNYTVLKHTVAEPGKRSWMFTFILFGLHYALFVYFIPLVFKGMFVELTIVFVYDLFLVYLASFMASALDAKVSSKAKMVA